LVIGALHLSVDELNELSAQVSALLQSYDRPGTRPAGSRRVDLIFRALPKAGP